MLDIDAHLRQLLLGRHAELLLLVDNKQSQVVEFHLLAQDLVRTDQDVDATLGQLECRMRDVSFKADRLRYSTFWGKSRNRCTKER